MGRDGRRDTTKIVRVCLLQIEREREKERERERA